MRSLCQERLAGVQWCGNAVERRQIFWSRNGAPANIVGHRWNANTEAFRQITSYSLGWPSISLFSGPNCPQTRDLASKISKKFPGVTPPDTSAGGGDPLRHPPRMATRRARGRKLPRCWDLGLGNHSLKSKFTTTPLAIRFHKMLCRPNSINCVIVGTWLSWINEIKL